MNAIRVIDYDPAWPGLFAEERRRLSVLLDELVEEIHHVGSTSVPGLSAKPKLDIDTVLLSSDALPQAIERVKSLGEFTFHGEPYRDGMWTFTSGHGSFGTRLYLCGPDNATHAKRMLFRDWLRTHPADAADYASLKLKLAASANGDWSFYTGGKAEFVANIVARAAESAEIKFAGDSGPASA